MVSRKTRLLLKRGWDETNVDEMTEQDFKDAGMTNAMHTVVNKELMEHELAEAMAKPDEYILSGGEDRMVANEEELVREAREELEENLEAFDEFQK